MLCMPITIISFTRSISEALLQYLPQNLFTFAKAHWVLIVSLQNSNFRLNPRSGYYYYLLNNNINDTFYILLTTAHTAKLDSMRSLNPSHPHSHKTHICGDHWTINRADTAVGVIYVIRRKRLQILCFIPFLSLCLLLVEIFNLFTKHFHLPVQILPLVNQMEFYDAQNMFSITPITITTVSLFSRPTFRPLHTAPEAATTAIGRQDK